MSRTLFESDRQTRSQALDATIASLHEYGSRYHHWAIAYSGGKDSTAVATVVVHLIESCKIPRPQSLTVLYADTGMEMPPLQACALSMLQGLKQRGIRTEVVRPALDDRFLVYILGRGVPPPKNRFRWCTPQLKVEPMERALMTLRQECGQKLLMLTGVRQGESAARDARIALSCTKDGGECGQGWFQQSSCEAVADTLAPLLHWRLCHVWDWLYFDATSLGFPVADIAEAYGIAEEGSASELNARTGCVGCPLASRDNALERLIRLPQWAYLQPLTELRPFWAELQKHGNRIRKSYGETKADGSQVKNPGRIGPLKLEARRWGLSRVLDIQERVNVAAVACARPVISLINAEEKARIEKLIAANTWPNRWTGEEISGDTQLPEELIGTFPWMNH